MLKKALLLSSILTIAPCAELVAGSPEAQNNQVNLKITRVGDHIKIECSPINADTSSRQDWKSLCNEMAAPQVGELVASGMIESQEGSVYDKATTEAAVTSLTKVIPLAPKSRVISGDTNLIVVGATAPKGYPKTRVEKSNGFCLQITDSWEKDSVSQQTIWIKNTERVSVSCGS